MKTVINVGQFITRFPQVVFRRNTQIADCRDVKNYIYFLESGLVKQYSISRSGVDFMTYLYHTGSFFPPTAISREELNSCYFESLSQVTVRIIPTETFIEYLHSNPELVLDLVNRLSKHFALMSSRMNLLAGGTAYQRTAAALLYLGERMGDSLEGNGKIILNQIVTHRDLAAWCGSARETTSVNMKILERKGLISYNKRRIVINSIDKLLRESGE